MYDEFAAFDSHPTQLMGIMRHPRHWSNVTWIACLLIVVCLLIFAALLEFRLPSPDSQENLARLAPIAGALIALGSLIVTAASTTALWRRQKRQATIEAWTRWSDATAGPRERITKCLGKKNLSPDQARGLGDDSVELRGSDGIEIVGDKRRQLVSDVICVLNGLERLATGIKMGVYDSATIRTLGATIVVRTYERLQSYIEYRRVAAGAEDRQKFAFVALEEQVRELKAYELDRERLTSLSQQ